MSWTQALRTFELLDWKMYVCARLAVHTAKRRPSSRILGVRPTSTSYREREQNQSVNSIFYIIERKAGCSVGCLQRAPF